MQSNDITAIITISLRVSNLGNLAMWGNHTQRVKIVINDNIIDQVTDFKYLGYRISEYKSDLEDKRDGQ